MSPRPFVKTFKKVIFFINASFGVGFTNDFLATGTDGIAPNQTTATDVTVPTGSRIRFFEVQFAANNPVATPIYINCTLQYILVGQGGADPNTIGGNPQRNQVLHMDMFSVGFDQNSNHKFKFKIPPKFQRIREGMSWVLTWHTSGTVNRQMQCIYKIES